MSNICPDCGEESVPYDCRCVDLQYEVACDQWRRRDRLMGWVVNAFIVALVLGLFWYGVTR